MLGALVEWLLALILLVAGAQAAEPTPTATPVVQAPEPTQAVYDGIPGLICSYSWPCAEAVSVAWCESRHQPLATGALGERGLFQLRPEYHQARADRLFGPGANLYDPYINTATAHSLWLELGWQPWSCARGAY